MRVCLGVEKMCHKREIEGEKIKEEISSRIKHKIIIGEFLSILCVPLRTHHLSWLQVTRQGSSYVSKEISPFFIFFNLIYN